MGATDVTEQEPGADRILTIPNLITLARLLCLPIFVWLLFHDHRVAAAWLLAALGVTDFLDGYIARHFNQGSDLGKIIDPVADRLLFFVGAGAILIDGSVPVGYAVAVLVREVLVSVATLALAAMGARRIDVTWFGKAGTLCHMVAFPFFLANAAPDLGWNDTAWVLGWGFAIPGLVLSYYALALYVPIARTALADGRSAKAPVGSTP
jgi:cardiolipin synthase